MIRSLAGLIHTSAAPLALVIGAIIFLRPKLGPPHRRLGYVYSLLMILQLALSFFLFHLTGHFNFLHVFSLVSLPPLVLGFYHAFARRPADRWLEKHFYWMTGSYLGLVSAFLAETSTRLLLPLWIRYFPGSAVTAFWLIVALTSALVLAGGIFLQRRNRPITARYLALVNPRHLG